ncbi:MAG: SH3 domain-containing protein [Phototrophicales bacterium]|nr:SH3 domain-containing protein [Phototrophicales bacterium]
MKRKLIFLSLLISLFMVSVSGMSFAQDRITDRYNQILAHLTGYLGLSSPIQFLDAWRWEEVINSNAGFDCPAPGVSYASTPNRYLKYSITYEGQTYDYRVNGDGTILVLCGAGGLPLVRLENGVNVLTALPPAPVASSVIAITPAPWHVWFYLPTADRLTLFNQTGEVATINRPRLPNEVIASENLRMSISRNGRYLVQAVKISPNTPTLSIYDFSTGAIRGIPLNPIDNVELGAGIDFYLSSGGSTYIFSPDSTSVAVSIARSDSPEFNEWRVMVIELATGAITRQIRHTEIAAITVAPSVEVSQAISGGFGSFRPNVIYWDNLGNIHFQLIYQFAGGSFTYPALAWNPATNVATVSPYNRVSTDILPTDGSIVYTNNEPALPALPSDGMFPSNNVIVRGLPIGTVMTPQQLLTTGEYDMFGARWITGGTQIAFLFQNNVDVPRWGIYTLATPATPFAQLSDGYGMLVGVSNGAVTIAEGFDTFIVTWHQNGTTPTNIGILPPMGGEPSILWAQPFSAIFGLTTLVTSDATTTIAPPPVVSTTPVAVPTSNIVIPVGATVLCAGSPVSIVRSGINGRVTVFNTGPVNVRQSAGTTFPVSRILPENARFAIIGGHQCVDGYTWWQIRLDDGVVGWVAEGTTSQYFIEPAP